MTIGQSIKKLRSESGLTQSRLAERLGVAEQTVSKWENDVCCPDVGVLPQFAGLFRVSIDRLFGFHLDSYEAEVDRIIEAEERVFPGNDIPRGMTDRISAYAAALKKYPNSEKLKLKLAWYHHMDNRMNAGGERRKAAAGKCEQYCREVIDTSVDRETLDSAHMILARLYAETERFDDALAAVEKISEERHGGKQAQIADILRQRGDLDALEKHAQTVNWECFGAMCAVNDAYGAALVERGETEKADRQYGLLYELQTLFDGGGGDFNLFHKAMCCFQRAFAAKKLNAREKCLGQFLLFAGYMERQGEVPEQKLSELNSHFSRLPEEIEYMPAGEAKRIIYDFIPKFDKFLADEQEFIALKAKYKTE